MRLASLAVALLLLPAAVARAQTRLPDRLELGPAPANLASPDELLEEARQSAARVTHPPSYGQSVDRLLQELRAALALERALAGIDGRAWPRLAAPAGAARGSDALP